MNKWRTVIALLSLGLILLVGLLIVSNVDGQLVAAIGMVYGAFAAAIIGLGGFLAGKSSVEHLANGSGIKGAIAALLTDAKPGTPPEASER